MPLVAACLFIFICTVPTGEINSHIRTSCSGVKSVLGSKSPMYFKLLTLDYQDYEMQPAKHGFQSLVFATGYLEHGMLTSLVLMQL